MDLFSRTMLASSAEAGLTTITLSRHVPLLRRNSRPADRVALLTPCVGSDGLGGGDHLLMLTSERFVITRQSRLLGRLRLCIDAPVAAVEKLRWSADPNGPGVELNFTLGGDYFGAGAQNRWHFWLPATHAKRMWRIDAMLAREFRRPGAAANPGPSSPAEFEGTLVGALAPTAIPVRDAPSRASAARACESVRAPQLLPSQDSARQLQRR